jgi:cell pole-organizing protein PopZ
MTRKTLDPNLASILDSIRATVGGEQPARPEAEAEEAQQPVEQETDGDPDPRASAPRMRAAKRAAASVPLAPAAPSPEALESFGGGRSVEEFLAELIRPQLDSWLKANLPELIQKMAAEEIARLTGRR